MLEKELEMLLPHNIQICSTVDAIIGTSINLVLQNWSMPCPNPHSSCKVILGA
jgi:hypothetical protein